MRILFCCDAPGAFSADRDTTRALIEVGWQRGHQIDWVDKIQLAWLDGAVQAHTAPLCPPLSHAGPEKPWFASGPAQWRRLDADYDHVIVRSDPPVDMQYLRMCQLLALLPDGQVCNAPKALVTHNEKLSALRFARWMAATMVSCDPNIHAQFAINNTKGVAKSLDSLGGEGVAAYGGTYGPVGAAHAAAAQFGASPTAMTMGQGWIERVFEGDKRVIMVEGEFAGVILRVPQAGEFRGNIHLGGQVQATTLTARERAIVADVGPWLHQEGILMAGLDLVGEFLTEINITSPTGCREIERLSEYRPTAQFWDALERNV